MRPTVASVLAMVAALTPEVTTAATAGPAGAGPLDSRATAWHSVPERPGAKRAAGAVSFSGDAGAVHEFSLSGGQYYIDVFAVDALGPTGTGKCLFSGNLTDLTDGQQSQIDRAGFVQSGVPYSQTATGTLHAGDYRLYIAPNSNCDWRFSIVPSGQGATLSIRTVGVYSLAGSNFVLLHDVPMNGETVYFIVSYNITGTLPTTLTGQFTLQESSGPLQKVSLEGFKDEEKAYATASFSTKEGDVAGPAVATFILTSGKLGVSKALHFTIGSASGAPSG